MADMIADALVSSALPSLPNDVAEDTESADKIKTLIKFSQRWKHSYGPSLSDKHFQTAPTSGLFTDEVNPLQVGGGGGDGGHGDDAGAVTQVVRTLGFSHGLTWEWWAKYGFYLIYAAPIPASVLVMGVTTIPLAPPSAGLMANWVWLLVYVFINPLIYYVVYMWVMVFMSELDVTSEGSSPSRQVFVEGCVSATLNTVVQMTVGATHGFPIPHSFYYTLASIVIVQEVKWARFRSRMLREGRQTEASKFVYMMFFTLTLGMGWSLAAVLLRSFNMAHVAWQTVLMAVVALWKGVVSTSIKNFSLLVELHEHKYEVISVVVMCVSVQWFWIVFSNVAFAAVESTVTFVVYLVIDMGTAGWFMWLCSDYCQSYKLVKTGIKWGTRLNWEKKTEEESAEMDLDKRFDVLFNFTMYALIQFGELTFAVIASVLFALLRYGPNSDYSPLGESRLSEDNYVRLQTFFAVVIASELFTTVLTMVWGVRKLGIDPRPGIGHWMGVHGIVFLFVIPLVLVLPMLGLLFDHSAMGFTVGE